MKIPTEKDITESNMEKKKHQTRNKKQLLLLLSQHPDVINFKQHNYNDVKKKSKPYSKPGNTSTN